MSLNFEYSSCDYLYIICLPEPLTDALLHRVPAVEKAEIRQMINGPESFTPDSHAVLGEAPKVSLTSTNILSYNLIAIKTYCSVFHTEYKVYSRVSKA